MLVYHNCEINGDGAVNIFDATVVGSRMFAIGITVRGICPDPLSKDKDDWFSFKPLDDGNF